MAASTVERVQTDPCLEHVRKLPASELEALIYCILRQFTRWASGEYPQLDSCAALVTNICFVRSVPLFEASSLLYAIRDGVVDLYKLERLRAGGSVDPEGSEEDGIRFFDLVVFELLKGY